MKHSSFRNRLNAARRRRKANQEESGTTVVEGALVFALFFGLVLAVIEFGLFFLFWSTGRNAASESAHEAAVVGSNSSADYVALKSVRKQLNDIGGRLDYFIIYRAKGIKDTVPQSCLDAAEAGKSTGGPNAPHGVFSGGGSTSVETFDWFGSVRPDVACNIYYRRNLDLIPDNENAFVYNPDPAALAATPSLDRNWPGGFRTDWITGPVDYVGIYIQARYYTATGIVPSRIVKHRAIVQIEPKRANR
jgi:hypothetical protein